MLRSLASAAVRSVVASTSAGRAVATHELPQFRGFSAAAAAAEAEEGRPRARGAVAGGAGDGPAAFVLRTLRANEPCSVADLWSHVEASEREDVPSRRRMKILLKFLKETGHVKCVPPESERGRKKQKGSKAATASYIFISKKQDPPRRN
mmetsp:Transcript_16530/g.53938  ORF Transcript_16530/g.53938 Transcript_16530/m.53938 type:complete len:150 (+) Transcript_16530:11-460(+)